MIRTVGIDVHKRVAEVCILDDQGKVLQRDRIPVTRDSLSRYATEQLRSSDRVALEATTNTWAVVRLLQPHVGEVVVSNPLKTRAIAEAKVKTDKVDAEVLAQLLRADYLPRVWIPDQKTQRMRELTSRRASLVAERTASKNRLHAVLHQRLVEAPKTLFSKAGLQWLRELELDELGREAIDSELRLIEGLEAEIARLDDKIAVDGYREDKVRLLMTIPGVDVGVASGLLAALGDVRRFRSADHAASYLGLVPRTKQSASHTYHGPITKQGRGHARWLLVQAAQIASRNPGPHGHFFARIQRKKNRNVAVVALARKLVTIAWHMLKKGEPYRYAMPRSTESKLARLRVKATGKKRRRGPAKGTAPRRGVPRTRKVPSLAEVCAAEQLPSPTPYDDFPAGEKRALAQARAVGHAKAVQTSHRVPSGRRIPKGA